MALLAGPATAAPSGPCPCVVASGALLIQVRAERRGPRRGARIPAGSRFNTVARGAIGGDGCGNAVTGSAAAPSGRRACAGPVPVRP